MRSPNRVLSLLLACIVLGGPPARAQDFPPLKILVPTFKGSNGSGKYIGWRAASILGLQIWRTYNAPTKKRSAYDNADFHFYPDDNPVTFEKAEDLARRKRKDANLVLWGTASKYGEGIIVEPNLLVRKAEGKGNLGTNIWSVSLPTAKGLHTVSVDIPRTRYEFAPIVLDAKLITRLVQDRPLAPTIIPFKTPLDIEIYNARSVASDVIGFLSTHSIQAIRHDGDWSYVQTDGRGNGWVYLPDLSRNPSEAVNFSGGLIRILRTDWPGAVGLFQQVVGNSGSPTAIKIDAYLYMAIAHDKLGEEAQSFSMVAAAYELNPYSKTTTQYLCMHYLSRLARLLRHDDRGAQAQELARSARLVLSRNRVLFAEDDGWVTQVEQVLAELADG